jgi:hypothetical protein
VEQGIRFKWIWEDFDLLEVVISAWNGEFGGAVQMYLGHGELVEAAQALEGFPCSTKDERRIALGDVNNLGDQASAILHFYIKDLAGHAVVELNLTTGSYPRPLQKVTLRASLEAAAMDTFVADLKKIEDQMDSTAFLRTIND